MAGNSNNLSPSNLSSSPSSGSLCGSSHQQHRTSLDTSYIRKKLILNDDCMVSPRNPGDAKESKVLVLYSGGTIGMIKNKNGVLAPEPAMMEKKLRTYPQLHDSEYAEKMFPNVDCPPLVLPHTGDNFRVVYTVYEYQPLLDSSNMTMDDWIRISLDVQHFYMSFDGFVILHGTGTFNAMFIRSQYSNLPTDPGDFFFSFRVH